MLRLGQKAASRLQNDVQTNWIGYGRRSLSGGQGSSNTARNVLVGSGLVACGCGGTIAYAKFNPDFRKSVESNVPPTKSMFKMILGKPRKEMSDRISTVSKSKLKKKTTDPLEAPIKDSRKSQAAEENSKVEMPPLPVVPAPQIEEPPKIVEETHVEEKLEKNFSVSEPPSPQATEVEVKSEVEKPVESKVVPENADATQTFVEEASPTALTEQADKPQVLDEPEAPGISRDEVETRMLHQELEELADAAATSVILDELLNACSIACSDAILSNVNAANAISLHSSLLRTATDDSTVHASEKSLQWEDVAHAYNEMTKSQTTAERAFHNAIEELTKIKHLLKETNCENNPDLARKVIDVDRDCMNMSHDIEEAKAKVQGKLLEAEVLNRYLHDIESMKEKFRGELELPTVNLEPEWKRTGKRVNREEETTMLLHMQHRVEELQKELSEERTLGAERLEEVVESVRSEVEDHVRKLADLDLTKRLEEERLNHEEQVAEMQRSHDDDMRRQLKRQASAHVEHMSEALSYMERQAASKYEKLLEETVENQKTEFLAMMEAERAANEAKTASIIDQHQLELEMAIARVRGIEQAVDGRAHIDNATRKAQELSLACDALLMSIKYGDKGKPVPLSTELNTVKKVYDCNEAVDVFSSAVPTEAVERGVYTEDILRAAFTRIGKLCRRVSLVDQNRNSLFIYFMSYLKSLLTVSSAQLAPPTEIDQSTLDVFTIISYANYCLEHGNLEQAARFVNQLTGEPRRVVEGWLKEARLLLETRQAIEALATVSKGLVIGSQLEM